MSSGLPQSSSPVLLLVHGWALGAGSWQSVCRLLPDYHCLTPDLGFFAAARPVEIPVDRPVLAVGHSLGFLWLLQQLPHAPWRHNCIGLLGIAAFSRFARAEHFPEGVPGRLLQRMRQRLPENPHAVLQEFARQGGRELSLPHTLVAVDSLLQGLDWLATWDGRESLHQWTGRVANLAAQDDQIVPALLSNRCFNAQQCHWLPEGGHLLPITQPQACAHFIQQFLPETPYH
ncbi:alpha/beta fold hydrolase [Candidatus Magnetaquicoccus inordinatus]|uniref:alpha/beta fold hydrolase n=1 Tax=Candidatus Magnetaquicoccus inordinatus TaxID=2496818 RepID=UPI00102B367B|nr:alpha/beta hydrolase [Candidatus Magnetaquicoccus inordinatus]